MVDREILSVIVDSLGKNTLGHVMSCNNTTPFVFLPNHVIGAFSYPYLESQKRLLPVSFKFPFSGRA